MQVILLEKIKHLGGLGDKVQVKPGYARNYLIPQGKAVAATVSNLQAFEQRRAELEKNQGEKLAYAQTRATRLQGIHVIISSKVGLEGKLFGSVNAVEIAKAISSTAGIEVTKQEVRLSEGSIRQIGDYEVELHLHTDVHTTVKIQVIPEA